MCSPAVFLLRLLRTGKRGRPSTCPLFNAPPQPSKAAMALWRHSITISEACRSGATRCGRFSIPSIAVPQMARRPQHGFSGGSFLTFLKQCYRKSMPCPGLENAIRPWRQLVDVMRCPALSGYPTGQIHACWCGKMPFFRPIRADEHPSKLSRGIQKVNTLTKLHERIKSCALNSIFDRLKNLIKGCAFGKLKDFRGVSIEGNIVLPCCVINKGTKILFTAHELRTCFRL